MLHLNIPMLIAGDFNCILQSENNKGGKSFRVDHPTHEFRSFHHLSRMIDLEYNGSHYTWCNNRLGLSGVWEHIDYAFATENWLDSCSTSIVTNFIRFASDRYLLLINVSNIKNVWSSILIDLFQFEKF